MLNEFNVGEVLVADGVKSAGRAGRLAEQIVSELNGRYYELTKAGRTFSLALTSTSSTVAAGNINAAAAAAVTQFALWNPVSSGVVLQLLKVFIGPISGIAPVAGCFHNVLNAPAPTIASVGTAYNNYIGGQPPRARYVSSAAGVALTGGTALTVLRPMAMNVFAGALSSSASIQPVVEEMAGDIILPPGTGWVPCWTASGTTFLNSYGVVWAENPL